MSGIIRKLSKSDLKIWENLILDSPQATLFHTQEWNQMLRETDSESYPEYLVYDNGGVVLAGISLILTNGKVDIPMMGYNGPIIASSLNYDQPFKTARGYDACTELIKYINGFSKQAVIKNHPEIWNIRPFTFLDWNIETAYTHLIHYDKYPTTAPKFKESLINKIEEGQFLITTKVTKENISKYCSVIIHNMNSPLSAMRRQKEILEKRIQWLLSTDLAKMILLINSSGAELAMVLLLFSKPNRTVYLWKVCQLGKGNKRDYIPSLVWYIVQSHSGNFDRFDLGESETMEISMLKDDMGGVLTPIYIVRSLKG